MLALSALCGRAQETDALPTLKMTTRLVSVSALVTGKDGQATRGLHREDFLLKQDGQEQTISYFSEGSDLPLTLALMVDTSGSQTRFIADETAASKEFFPQMLTRPEDRALLVQFDTNVLRLHRVTHPVDALETALEHLSEPHEASGHSHGGTLLYDAIVAVSRSELLEEEGRRAMVILTDGGDNGSNNTLSQAVGAALSADVVIYSVFYSAVPASYAGRGIRALQTLSNATGGEVFTVDAEHPLEKIYSSIAEAMRLQYQLGYKPPESAPGVFHTIDLRARNKKLTVRARKGFFTPGKLARAGDASPVK